MIPYDSVYGMYSYLWIYIPKKNIDYNIELFIQKHPITVTVILMGINLSEQDFFILWSKLKFLLSAHLRIG